MSSIPLPPLSLADVRQHHACLVKSGHFRSTFAASRLLYEAVHSYPMTRPSSLSYAHSIFSRIRDPNSFAWNVMIQAYCKSGQVEQALQMFVEMLHSRVFPDKFTFPMILKLCAAMNAYEEVQQVHARILKTGFDVDMFVQNTLVHAYARVGLEMDALNVFNGMAERDVVSWNVLISFYAASGLMGKARGLFEKMAERDAATWNYMIAGYANLGLFDVAREIFDRMIVRNAVSWNTLITAYARAGLGDEVFKLFRAMQGSNVKPDVCTLLSVLSCCAQVGSLGQGEWVHAYIMKNGIAVGAYLCTALVNMYSKCGSIDKALWVFNNSVEKDISSWNSMIAGLSRHGCEDHALKLFEEMLSNGVEPNEITYVHVLTACSHGGLLEKGLEVFDDMVNVWKIKPNISHYGCLVDMLGRAGEFEVVAKIMKLVSAPELWESLLHSARSFGNIDLAEYAARQLMDLAPKCGSSYVQLSNAYASVGRWKDVKELRGFMEANEIVKEPGCSIIEVDGIVQEFFSGDL